MESAFHLVDVKVQDLTPAIVKEYRGIPGSATEREINEAHVKKLRERAEGGRSVVYHWATAEVKDKPGQLIRINGQHSSEMLSQLDGTMPSNLKVVREHYLCQDRDAVALLFQQFDARFSTRSTADIAGVYQGIQSALKDVPKPYAKLAIDGFTWFARYVGKTPVPIGDEAYGLMAREELHPFIIWLGQTLTSKTRELQPRGVIGAMYGTFEASSSKAREFWEQVSRGGDPDDEDCPATRIDMWLREIYEGRLEIDKLGAGNYFQACINAWNAHIDGKSLSTVRYEVKKNFAPIRD